MECSVGLKVENSFLACQMQSHVRRQLCQKKQRLEMFQAFKKTLDDYNRPYILVKGNKEDRFKKAKEAIDKILAQKTNLYSYTESLKR